MKVVAYTSEQLCRWMFQSLLREILQTIALDIEFREEISFARFFLAIDFELR
jgi:hypothetical protein